MKKAKAVTERKERFTVSRRKKILERIKETGEVLVSRLSKEFNVSEVTIRNDLEHLERKNLLVRARGGAIHTENHVGIDQRIAEKNKLHATEKAAIGKKAASLINDGDTIIIDSGTTTAEIVKHLDGIVQFQVFAFGDQFFDRWVDDHDFVGRNAPFLESLEQLLGDDGSEVVGQAFADGIVFADGEEIEDTVDGRGRGRSVNGAEHQVAGLGGINGGLERVHVAQLAHQHHIGIFANGIL